MPRAVRRSTETPTRSAASRRNAPRKPEVPRWVALAAFALLVAAAFLLGRQQGEESALGTVPETPSIDVPADPSLPDESSPENPAQETPENPAPEQGTPEQEAPAEEAPADEVSTEESPAEEPADDETPSQPVREQPAQQVAQEQPVQESPAQPRPAEELPAQDQPAQEQPAVWAVRPETARTEPEQTEPELSELAEFAEPTALDQAGPEFATPFAIEAPTSSDSPPHADSHTSPYTYLHTASRTGSFDNPAILIERSPGRTSELLNDPTFYAESFQIAEPSGGHRLITAGQS